MDGEEAITKIGSLNGISREKLLRNGIFSLNNCLHNVEHQKRLEKWEQEKKKPLRYLHVFQRLASGEELLKNFSSGYLDQCETQLGSLSLRMLLAIRIAQPEFLNAPESLQRHVRFLETIDQLLETKIAEYAIETSLDQDLITDSKDYRILTLLTLSNGKGPLHHQLTTTVIRSTKRRLGFELIFILGVVSLILNHTNDKEKSPKVNFSASDKPTHYNAWWRFVLPVSAEFFAFWHPRDVFRQTDSFDPHKQGNMRQKFPNGEIKNKHNKVPLDPCAPRSGRFGSEAVSYLMKGTALSLKNIVKNPPDNNSDTRSVRSTIALARSRSADAVNRELREGGTYLVDFFFKLPEFYLTTERPNFTEIYLCQNTDWAECQTLGKSASACLETGLTRESGVTTFHVFRLSPQASLDRFIRPSDAARALRQELKGVVLSRTASIGASATKDMTLRLPQIEKFCSSQNSPLQQDASQRKIVKMKNSSDKSFVETKKHGTPAITNDGLIASNESCKSFPQCETNKATLTKIRKQEEPNALHLKKWSEAVLKNMKTRERLKTSGLPKHLELKSISLENIKSVSNMSLTPEAFPSFSYCPSSLYTETLKTQYDKQNSQPKESNEIKPQMRCLLPPKPQFDLNRLTSSAKRDLSQPFNLVKDNGLANCEYNLQSKSSPQNKPRETSKIKQISSDYLVKKVSLDGLKKLRSLNSSALYSSLEKFVESSPLCKDASKQASLGNITFPSKPCFKEKKSLTLSQRLEKSSKYVSLKKQHEISKLTSRSSLLNPLSDKLFGPTLKTLLATGKQTESSILKQRPENRIFKRRASEDKSCTWQDKKTPIHVSLGKSERSGRVKESSDVSTFGQPPNASAAVLKNFSDLRQISHLPTKSQSLSVPNKYDSNNLINDRQHFLKTPFSGFGLLNYVSFHNPLNGIRSKTPSREEHLDVLGPKIKKTQSETSFLQHKEQGKGLEKEVAQHRTDGRNKNTTHYRTAHWRSEARDMMNLVFNDAHLNSSPKKPSMKP